MIVIADTSPLNYLLLIGEIDLLPKLYPHIAIPPAVQVELRNADAPDIVRAWIENPPAWLAIMAPHSSDDPRLSALDSGEREALALALELRADLVLIDERDARAVAELCGLTVAGTMRVLASAANLNLVDLEEAFGRLRCTSFRVHPYLMEQLLQQNASHRKALRQWPSS